MVSVKRAMHRLGWMHSGMSLPCYQLKRTDPHPGHDGKVGGGEIATAARISSFGPISNAWQLLVLLVARDTNEKMLRNLIKTNDVNIAVKKM